MSKELHIAIDILGQSLCLKMDQLKEPMDTITKQERVTLLTKQIADIEIAIGVLQKELS